MDSVFSPILSVGINVENTRVGKMTNWDKLILDIVTDGTISVEEAFTKSVETLIEQFNSLLKSEKKIDEVVESITEESKEEEKQETGEEKEETKKRRGRPKKG